MPKAMKYSKEIPGQFILPRISIPKMIYLVYNIVLCYAKHSILGPLRAFFVEVLKSEKVLFYMEYSGGRLAGTGGIR